jgi:N-terminal region of glycosyl transferase group 7/N-terminal domain of galactosyltransferase
MNKVASISSNFPTTASPQLVESMEIPPLLIVVPYRNREAHFKSFVPHVRAYFARDKADRHIPYRVLIVEQEGNGPFNRGALKNIGFALGASESAYTCFHDIDYLPIWADYSYSDEPTMIVWHGVETRPIAPDKTRRLVVHDMDALFGGVVIIPNTIFTTVNGYSNEYWGWGFEDYDLRRRFLASGVKLAHRKGTFAALEHPSEGHQLDGMPTPAHFQNEQRMLSKWAQSTGGGSTLKQDGLSTLKYEVISRQTIPDPVPEREVPWEIVKVQLQLPMPERT